MEIQGSSKIFVNGSRVKLRIEGKVIVRRHSGLSSDGKGQPGCKRSLVSFSLWTVLTEPDFLSSLS